MSNKTNIPNHILFVRFFGFDINPDHKVWRNLNVNKIEGGYTFWFDKEIYLPEGKRSRLYYGAISALRADMKRKGWTCKWRRDHFFASKI